jgi:hypothetical protein
MTRDTLLEVFHYNNKRLTDGYAELKNVRRILLFYTQQNYEYLTTRVQDDIYLRYAIEPEELAACYKKWSKNI